MIETKDIPSTLVAGISVISAEEILNIMEPYLIIDPMERNLDQISLRAGRAFGQCQRIYLAESRGLEHFMNKKKQVELHLRRYYSGQANPEVYAMKPLRVSILKTELDIWINADETYIEICSFVEEQKRKVKMLEQMLDRIKSMGYEIKSTIEWRKYLDGN